MNDTQALLIVDAAMRFESVLPLEPVFAVHRVATGAEALRFLETNAKTAIVIINIESDIQESISLMAAIRAQCGAESPVVALCLNRGDVQSAVYACEAGAEELIFRPIDPKLLEHQFHKLRHLSLGRDAFTGKDKANQLHAVIDGLTTGVGIFAFENDKVHTLYTNEAFMAGAHGMLTHECVTGDDVLALLPEKEAAAVLSAIHANLQSGVPIDMPFHIQYSEELTLSLRLRALPIHYEGRETPVFLANLTDVTSQRQVEDALRESNLKLSSLMNAVPGGIAVYDLAEKPRLLYYNDVLRNMCGYTAEEYDQIMVEDYHRLIDPRDQSMIDSVIDDFRREPKQREAFFRVVAKDGSTRWMRVSVSPVGQGTLCNAVFIDVTRDKENEARTEQMINELYYRADHDSLTGIANREAFYRKTAELLRQNPGTAYVLLAMDIDRFKVINDMFGKEVGDRILIAIGQGLEHMLCKVGLCARMEADHFMACFPQKLLQMERITSLMDRGLKRQNIDYHIQMSYGIYLIHNTDVPVHHMCDRAMMAMKTIKGNALQRYAYYDDQLRQTLLEENDILDDMNDALLQNQFVAYLQPIFSVDTTQPVSAEVLVRWHHPQKGILPPGSFIPLFERNGFISKMDHFIWERACELLEQWKAIDYPLPISVNISRIDLYNPHLCDQLLELLSRHGVSPSLLRLEITESAYSKDPDDLVKSIERLRAAGFSILMDDFGSGYSSLNVLMDMPVDALKLDMRFLAKLNTNPRAASILTSVVRMAKWLRMPVVAEGVETLEQLSFLRSIGCDHVQGYLFARPMQIEAYTAKYITGEPTDIQPDLPVRLGSVDLSCLWEGSPQADALFNGMIGGMGIFERCGETLEVRRVNDGYYELFGCTPRQVFQGAQEALFTVHPDDREGLMQVLTKATQTGRVERYVCRHILSRDGRQIWLEARVRHLGKAGLNDVFCFTFTDVTEQKEFEQSLTLKNYAMVLRSVYSGVYELNLTRRTTRAVYVSGCLTAATQDDQPLTALKTMMDSLLVESDEELQTSIFQDGYLQRRLRENPGGYYLTERRVHVCDRLTAWASFTFIRVPADAADELYLLCVANVDTRKRADDLLKENQWLLLKQQEQERYQALMEYLGTSLLDWDLYSGRVSLSSGFERFAVHTYDFTQLKSHKDMESFVYQPDLGVFRMFVNNLLAHGNASVTLRLYDRARMPLWCRVLCSLVTDEHGRITRCVAAVNQVDEEMKIRENHLDDQSRFQAFSENFMVGLGVFEVEGNRHRILSLSSGYSHMVGYGPDEPLYDETHSYIGVHPDDLPRFQEATKNLLQTNQPYTIDYRVFHKDGHVLWMRSLNSVFKSPKTGNTRIFAVIQDITELHAASEGMKSLVRHIPMPLGIYELGDTLTPIMENARMEAWQQVMTVSGSAEGSSASPTLGADVRARLKACYDRGQTELDEPVTLLSPDGTLTSVRLLAASAEVDGQKRCYCAIVESPPPSQL